MVKHIRTLWRGDKGRLPTQFELPPLTADGIGFPFAVSEGRHELCLCNQTHLLLWRKIHQKAEFLGAFQPEAAVKAQFWGVASDSEGWVVVYQEAEKLWVALLDARLRWRDRIPLRGYLKDYNLAPPLRVASHRDRVYLADTQSLVIVDRKGHTDAVRSCPYGYALQGDTLLCPTERGEVPAPSATLVGTLSEGADLVWTVEEPVSQPNQPYLRTQILITKNREVTNRLWLNGVSGILQPLRSASQVEWVVVGQQKRVYVLGWVYAGIRRSVWLWSIDL